MSEPIQSNIPPSQREEYMKAKESSNKAPTEPGVAGPGASATAPEKPKPHDSKIINKLDPRFDEDVLEAEKRGELGHGK